MDTWTMNYIKELEARIKEIEKRNIENAKNLGEAIGALKGILHNDIDEELKVKIEHIIKRINVNTHIK